MKGVLRLFRNLQFQNKLLLSYLLVVLIPLGAWGVYSYRQMNNTLMQQAQETFRDMCISATEEINAKYQRVESAFSTMAGNPTIGRIINTEYDSGYQKYYDIVHIYDPNMETVCTFNPEIIRIHIYTEGNIKGARLTFHDLNESLAEHEILREVNDVSSFWYVEDGSLFVGRRIFDPTDFSRSAIMAAELDFQAIMENEFMEKIARYQVLIQDAEGEEIYNHISDSFISPGTAEVTAEQNGVFSFQDSLLPEGWTITIRMKDQDIMVSSFFLAFESPFLQIGIAMVFPIFIIPFLTHIMVKRIEVLNSYLRRVAKGGFQEDISSDDRDEIGSIINNVGRMVREMRRLIKEVYESQQQQRKAEIKALQAQINPHLLYNTLSAVNWQAIKSGNVEISKLVTSLSAFYRSTLNEGKSIASVQQELEMTQAYLEIEQQTHQSDFDIKYEVDESLLEYNMPGIILQPIVENAIEHGVRMKTDGQRGSIRITVCKEGSDILFEIYDNGPGIPKEAWQKILYDDRRGYGIKNVNQRIKLFFGNNYGLTLQNTEEAGTCIQIRIPTYIDLESLNEQSSI